MIPDEQSREMELEILRQHARNMQNVHKGFFGDLTKVELWRTLEFLLSEVRKLRQRDDRR